MSEKFHFSIIFVFLTFWKDFDDDIIIGQATGGRVAPLDVVLWAQSFHIYSKVPHTQCSNLSFYGRWERELIYLVII